MGKTIIEKIFSARVGREVQAGELVIAPVDFVMGQDTKTPAALDILRSAGLPVRIDRRRVALVIDHAVPCFSADQANRHAGMRHFAEEQGIRLYDSHSGIGHILIPEQGHIGPGQIVASGDAHGTTYGAINAAGIGVGSTELAVAMATGKLWFKVPPTLQVTLSGKLQAGVFSKDVVIHLIGRLGETGANYHAVEYVGDAVASMSMDARFTICNMSTDMGAKVALMDVDEVTRRWLSERPIGPWHPVEADPDASYAGRIEIEVSSLPPQVAAPHSVANALPIDEVVGTRIHQASIGTCTNGRLEDLRIAAAIVKGRKVASGVRFYTVAGSREIYRQAMREGILETLFEAGATIVQACCATCSSLDRQGTPGDGEVVISAANRNFRGRLGNRNASIYLASPATVAASALEGAIADPRQHSRALALAITPAFK